MTDQCSTCIYCVPDSSNNYYCTKSLPDLVRNKVTAASDDHSAWPLVQANWWCSSGADMTNGRPFGLHPDGPIVTVAALPPAATVGQRHMVSDAQNRNFGTTVSGGGSNVVPVFSDGSNWLIG